MRQFGSMTSRNRQLDVLHAVAILMVLSAGLRSHQSPVAGDVVCRHGWAGVDLFFVLIGYLVSVPLLTEFKKTGGIRFKRFAFRRAMKICLPCTQSPSVF